MKALTAEEKGFLISIIKSYMIESRYLMLCCKKDKHKKIEKILINQRCMVRKLLKELKNGSRKAV